MDISEFLEKKKEYAAICYYRFHMYGVKTMEEAKKKAEELEPYGVLTTEARIPRPPEESEKHECLK